MVGYICKIDAADSEEITEVIRGTVCIVLSFILKKGGKGGVGSHQLCFFKSLKTFDQFFEMIPLQIFWDDCKHNIFFSFSSLHLPLH